MQFFSTRGTDPVTLDLALLKGIAEDGGLFMPDQLPRFDERSFRACDSIRSVAATMLRPFFAGSLLESELDAIVDETYAFPIPTSTLRLPAGPVSLLELYHGPTAAFKDVGAAFLAASLTRLEGDVDAPLTILVATSGDTGGAVAAAFDGRPGMRVVVLFPDGRVSERQAQQLCCWGDNVLSLAVQGAFDDCQALAKQAMAESTLAGRYRFSSANSINIGRLLPQCTYYAHASLQHFRKTGTAPGFVVPTGNLGNALAAIMAREMGLPIGPIVLATNANRTIADYFETLQWLPRASLHTLASAMDVGNPSNMERLRTLLGDAEQLRERIGVRSVDDDEIRDEIRRVFAEASLPICPHTATAFFAWRQLADDIRNAHDWILVATAHPAKFETIVEPLIGETVAIPPELAEILARPKRVTRIEPTLNALGSALQEGFD